MCGVFDSSRSCITLCFSFLFVDLYQGTVKSYICNECLSWIHSFLFFFLFYLVLVLYIVYPGKERLSLPQYLLTMMAFCTCDVSDLKMIRYRRPLHDVSLSILQQLLSMDFLIIFFFFFFFFLLEHSIMS